MENTEHYRAALHEGRDNQTGETVWFIRFLHTASKLDKTKLVWFSIPAGQYWFADTDDHAFFCDLIAAKRHVAVNFSRLEDAYGFLTALRPAELHGEAAQ